MVANTPDNVKVGLLKRGDIIHAYLKQSAEALYTDLIRGKQIKGVTLKQGASRHCWLKDIESKVEVAFKERYGNADLAYNKRLISIKDAEKLLGKEGVSPFIVKNTSKPKMILEEPQGS